ncbi:MAG: Ppx/GppA family phosphatase, partial [Alphaproteobacteria bacterium]
MLKILRPEWLEFSAFGIREGNLFERLDPAERAVDPLLAACADIATRESRFGNRGDLLFDWIAPLFDGDDEVSV